MASRNRVYTANEVVRLLNNTDYASFDSDSELESSSDESDSDSVDNIESESGSDSDSDATIIVDVVDDVTWSSSPVSNMRRLDFTGNAGLHVILQDPTDPLEYFESFVTTEILEPVVD